MDEAAFEELLQNVQHYHLLLVPILIFFDCGIIQARMFLIFLDEIFNFFKSPHSLLLRGCHFVQLVNHMITSPSLIG